MDAQALSEEIEARLVARNPRHMQQARAALEPGYLWRAAHHLCGNSGVVIIGTGFPVTGTFETDGPLGAIALYRGLASVGFTPHIACGEPLSASLAPDFRLLELTARDIGTGRRHAETALAELAPVAVISIERPGLAADGRYYNMRGEDISDRCFCFDPFIEQADCPTICIGDGGNEIGMGKIGDTLAGLDIIPSITGCDELLVADVSNWGAYGLLAVLGQQLGRDLLADFSPEDTLHYLSRLGSVDGVTGENTLTEDGMDMAAGLSIIDQLRRLAAGN